MQPCDRRLFQTVFNRRRRRHQPLTSAADDAVSCCCIGIVCNPTEIVWIERLSSVISTHQSIYCIRIFLSIVSIHVSAKRSEATIRKFLKVVRSSVANSCTEACHHCLSLLQQQLSDSLHFLSSVSMCCLP